MGLFSFSAGPTIAMQGFSKILSIFVIFSFLSLVIGDIVRWSASFKSHKKKFTCDFKLQYNNETVNTKQSTISCQGPKKPRIPKKSIKHTADNGYKFEGQFQINPIKIWYFKVLPPFPIADLMFVEEMKKVKSFSGHFVQVSILE